VFRFAHLINVSFFDDLFAVMSDLVDSGVHFIFFNNNIKSNKKINIKLIVVGKRYGDNVGQCLIHWGRGISPTAVCGPLCNTWR